MKSKTALVVFARTPIEESKYKPFQKSKLFFEKQEARIFQIGAKLGIDVLHYAEHNQVGSNFAERFTNAIQAGFNKGYHQLICIGSDTPHLKFQHLQKSLKQLQKGKPTLGLNKNDGFYLIAFHKHLFTYTTFLGFSWNTSKIGNEVFQYLSKASPVCLLPRFVDVNSEIDFKRLRNSAYTLYRALQKLITQCSVHFYQKRKKPLISAFPLMVLSNKAPPCSR